MSFTRSLSPVRSFTSVLSAGVAAAALALSLSACTISASLTAAPEKVATAASDALQQSVGVRPEMNCGADSIELKEGHSVVCELTDPNTGTKFDTMVTLVDVQGQSFSVDVEVGTTPKN